MKTGFDRFELCSELRRAIAAAGFTEPRPIQARALPPGLAGHDVLGLAQTGTGKTAAFVLPILERLLAGRGSGARPRGPRALVIAPTRELAAQVQTDFERLARFTPLRSAVVFGGVPIRRQVRELARRPDVVVACPGRLLDLLERRALRLDGVEVLVLDEADHMFDMGFLPDVRRILNALPKRRQNLMFSATMPPEIRRLADGVLHRPEVVELANARPAETIAHTVLTLGERSKLPALERLLSGRDFRSAIAFLRTKRRAKRLAQELDARGLDAIALQGNMSQAQRERALRGFREGRYDILVATDIAARGLDIAGVSHVVNYDIPGTPDAYTHRIGRTGRAEQAGTAYTFVTPGDAGALRAIERRLGAAIERLPLSELGPLRGERTLTGPRRSSSRNRTQGSGPGSARHSTGSGAPQGRGRRGRAGRADPQRGPQRPRPGRCDERDNPGRNQAARSRSAPVRSAPVRPGPDGPGPDRPAFGAGVFPASPEGSGNPKRQRRFRRRR